MRELDIKKGMGFQSDGASLDPETFDLLRHQITSASGIYIAADENSRYLIERRLMPRLRARGASTFAQYAALLDLGELEQMLDAVAIHETYFFREQRQLRVFSDQILPELEARGGPIRIWSAGCSTGEEAYTIGMLLADRRLIGGGRSQVVASDLSRRVIDIARLGLYGPSSFRTTADSFRERYFTSASAELWQASEELRTHIYFEQLNLINLDGAIREGPDEDDRGFDVIFCRNVLMYFDAEAVRSTLSSLYALLNEGGYMLLGHAEALLPIGTPFKPVQFGRECVHRK